MGLLWAFSLWPLAILSPTFFGVDLEVVLGGLGLVAEGSGVLFNVLEPILFLMVGWGILLAFTVDCYLWDGSSMGLLVFGRMAKVCLGHPFASFLLVFFANGDVSTHVRVDDFGRV